MKEKHDHFIHCPKPLITCLAVTASVLATYNTAEAKNIRTRPVRFNPHRRHYDIENNMLEKEAKMPHRLVLQPSVPPDENKIIALKSGNVFLERVERPNAIPRPRRLMRKPLIPPNEPIISSTINKINPEKHDKTDRKITRRIRKENPKIIYKENPNAYEDVVERQGVVGEYEDTVETIFLNGKKVSEKVIRTHMRTPVRDTIVVKGTKKTAKVYKTETRTMRVEPKTEYIDDPTITQDVVFREGSAGEILQTFENMYVNDRLVETKITKSEVKKEVVNKIIKRAKPVSKKGVPAIYNPQEGKVTTSKSEKKISIEPKVEYINDNTILEDVVEKQGEAGETIMTFETSFLNGRLVETKVVGTRVSKPVVNKVIRRAVPPETAKGTPEVLNKPEGVVTTSRVEHKITIEPQVEYVDDNSSYEDVVETQGEAGVSVQTIENTLLNGEIVESKIVDTKVEKPVVNKKIRRGTKKMRREVVEKIVPIESETEYIDDNTIVENKLVKTGHNGEMIQKIENVYENESLVSSKVISSTVKTPVQNTVIRKAVPPITEKGTPEVLNVPEAQYTRQQETRKKVVEAKVEYKDDETIPKDVIEQQGENGEITETIEKLYLDGKFISESVTKTEQTKPVKNTIIRRSTMKTSKGNEAPPVVQALPEAVITQKRTIRTEPVAYKVIERNDPELEEGQEKSTGGVAGSITHTIEEYYVDGRLVESKEIGNPQIVPAVNKIVTKGTKKKVVPKILMATRWVDENNKDIKPKAQQELTSASEFLPAEPGETPRGYIFLSTQNGAGGTTHVYKKLPYDRELSPNDKVEKRIETNRKVIKFETIQNKDPQLPKGDKVIDVVGADGYVETTAENHYINNKLVLSIPKKETTVKPVNQVERLGTKEIPKPNKPIVEEHNIPGVSVKVETVKKEKIINLEPVIEYDNKTPEGTETILEAGRPKRIEQTIEYTKVNNVVKNEKVVSEKVVDNGVPKKVKIGTMKTTTTREMIVEDENLPVEYVDDPNLDQGKEKTESEGKPRKIQKTIEKTLHNGVVVSTKVINTHILSEGTPKKVKRGTRIVKRLVDMGKVQDTSATQGLKENDLLTSGRNIRSIIIKDDKNIQDIMALSENERYKNAQNQGIINQVNTYQGNDNRRLLASTIPMSKGTENYINTHLDDKKFNLEMLKLVNAERTRLGKKPLAYGEHLQEGANLRAYEQAMIGHLRTNGKPHTRPDGTTFRTAFTYLNNERQSEMEQTLGENIAQYSASNFYQITSEKDMAERLYAQWKKSPGHYANIISDDYKYIAFTARIGRTNTLNPDYSDLFYSVIGVQTFQTNVQTPKEANTRSPEDSLGGGYLAGDKLGNLKILQPSDKDIKWGDVAKDKDKDNKAKDRTKMYYTLVKEGNDRLLYPPFIKPSVVNQWNNGTLVNHKQIENKVLELVNKDRASKSLPALTIAQPLSKGNQDRLNAMVAYGTLKDDHNGGRWDTAYTEVSSNYSSLGEISGGMSVSANPYATVSENHIANEIFKRIKSTPSHYDLLMTKDVSSINVGTGLTTNDKDVEGATLGIHRILYVITTSKK